MLSQIADSVIPAASGLEDPPPVDEREFVTVDLEYVDERRKFGQVEKRACQCCGEPVELLEPHAYACLWAESPSTNAGRIMHKLDFCDRDCWLAWMRG